MVYSMRKISGLFASVFVLMLFSGGCSKDDGGELPNPNPDDGKSDVEEVVTGSNTVPISNELISNLQSVENGVLVFDGALPENEIPQQGQILLSNTPTERFPYGFLGRVTHVESSGGSYRVETEPVPLFEAFEVLKIDKTVDLIPQDGTRASLEADEEGFYTFSQPITVTYGKGAVTASAEGTLQLGAKMHLSVDWADGIERRPSSIELDLKFAVDIEASLELDAEDHISVDLGPGISFLAIPGAIVITPKLQPKFVVEWSGKASMKGGVHFEKRFRQTLLMADVPQLICEEVGDDGDCQSGPFVSSCSLEGSLFRGISTAFELSLFGNDNMKVSIEPKIGQELSGNFSIDLTQENLYQSCRESKVGICLKVGAEASATANFWMMETEWTLPLVDWSFLKAESYLFPEFSNGKVDVGETSRTAQVQVKRDLLFPSEVGLALYRDDQLQEEAEARSYWIAKGFSNPLAATFGGLDQDGDYSVWSYVKWGDLFIKAERIGPSPIVGSWLAVYWIKDEYYEGEMEHHEEDLSAYGYILHFDADYRFRSNDGDGTWKEIGPGTYRIHDAAGSDFYGEVTVSENGDQILTMTESVVDDNYSLYSRVKYKKIEE